MGYQLPRKVPRDGVTIDGYYLPGDVCVLHLCFPVVRHKLKLTQVTMSTNAWALHHNMKVYGQDCDEFRPERWLERSDSEKVKEMEECYGSFGFGSRTCLGKNLALLEMYRVGSMPSIAAGSATDIELSFSRLFSGTSRLKSETLRILGKSPQAGLHSQITLLSVLILEIICQLPPKTFCYLDATSCRLGSMRS